MPVIALLIVCAAIGLPLLAAHFADKRCPTCGRKFATSDEMYHHLDREHLR